MMSPRSKFSKVVDRHRCAVDLQQGIAGLEDDVAVDHAMLADLKFSGEEIDLAGGQRAVHDGRAVAMLREVMAAGQSEHRSLPGVDHAVSSQIAIYQNVRVAPDHKTAAIRG